MRRQHGPRAARWWLVLAASGIVTLAQARPAAAHARGILVDSCAGCHSGTGSADVTLVPDRAPFNPGDNLTFTLTITSAAIRVGGVYVTAGGVGTLQALSGEGLGVMSQGLTHTSPKAATGGAVTFRFGWRAPSTPGNVIFSVAALAANGDNATSGDDPFAAPFQWVYGCTGQSWYADLDNDGYGATNYPALLLCAGAAKPAGYAASAGDCDQNDATVHPGAPEVCNGRDDNCDGQIDENAPPTMLWPDGDGDGYYKTQTGTPKMGCGGIRGYAALGGDCDDTDPNIHPGAIEVCNTKDDNCDGFVDERVRPQCGVGWCRRDSRSCDPKDCTPGPPATEVCNSLDDNCDGVVDEGTCPAGTMCSVTTCVPITDGGSGGVVSGGSGGGGGSVVTSGSGGAPASGSGGPSGGVANGGGQCAVAAGPSSIIDLAAGAGVLLMAVLTGGRRRKRQRSIADRAHWQASR